MAVVWKKQRENTRYEVRSAGRTLRLYTNGAFHTQFNPSRPLPGGVWDLLALPALAAQHTPRNSLVLGVGGGAVLRLLHNLGCSSVTGVELDPVHLQVARRFFGCDRPGIELIQADAIKWMNSAGGPFDVVIDDLFVDGPGDPERPAALGPEWTRKLANRVSGHGVLVMNHLSLKDARGRLAQNPWLKRRFASALAFQRPHFENAIVGLFRDALAARGARSTVRDRLESHGISPSNLEYRCTQLF